jgi:glycosyltransferase involved in cell wall biosynthesis
MDGIERIHYKTSPFTNDFIKTYSSKIPGLKQYYYYFSDHSEIVCNIKFVNGHVFNIISDHGGNFTRIVSDNATALDKLSQSIGCDVPDKSVVLYSECQVTCQHSMPTRPHLRILWASRIDPEKRPELIVEIARQLSEQLPKVSIDVFGTPTFNQEAVVIFDDLPNLQYHGEFSGFDDLPTDRYDAFLYTTAFDGLPNVILEASAAGLPVIAPNVGGIPEVVSDNTGYLIEDDVDKNVLVERYIDAIKALYDDWPGAVRRGENGRKLVAERHSREAFLKRVAEVFALEQGGKSGPLHNGGQKDGASLMPAGIGPHS